MKSLFEEEEQEERQHCEINLETDFIFLPRSQSLGNYHYPDRDQESNKSKAIFRANTAKVSTVCKGLMQKYFYSLVDIREIKEEAIQNLEGFFKEYELDNFHATMSNAQRERKRKLYLLKIQEESKRLLVEKISAHKTITLPFDYFIQIMPEKMVRTKQGRLIYGALLDLTKNMQNNSFVEFREDRVVVEDDQLKEEIVLSRTPLVPRIDFILDPNIESGGKKITSFDDLIQSPKRKKHKYIKSVQMTFEPELIASEILLTGGYAVTPLADRVVFQSHYTGRLDDLIRNLEPFQHLSGYNRYTVKNLNDMFGVNYKEYKGLKRYVLQPALDELNEKSVFGVALKTTSKPGSKQIMYVSFIIKRKELLPGTNRADTNTTISFLEYISVLRFMDRAYHIPEVKDVSREDYYAVLMSKYGDVEDMEFQYSGDKIHPDVHEPTLKEWYQLYSEDKEAAIKLQEYIKRDKEWFSSNNLYLASTDIIIKKADGSIFSPFGSYQISRAHVLLEFYLSSKGERG